MPEYHLPAWTLSLLLLLLYYLFLATLVLLAVCKLEEHDGLLYHLLPLTIVAHYTAYRVQLLKRLLLQPVEKPFLVPTNVRLGQNEGNAFVHQL